MDNLSHGRVIGIDVSRDWLDLYCLPDGHRGRAPDRVPFRGVSNGTGRRAFPARSGVISWPRLAG